MVLLDCYSENLNNTFMGFQKGKSKKGVKRAWCKKKLRQLFNVLTSSNSARVEATSKTLQLNKARIFCSTVLLIIVAIQPASAITPVIMVGHNASDTAATAEKACTLLCKVALTASKFTNTKEGRTAVMWLVWSGVAKGVQSASWMASPTYGTAAMALALFCSTAYSLETLIGPETFGGAEFFNHANKWCAKGYSFLSVTAILPKDTVQLAIKFLEGVKGLG
jgi:hypothetical protein